MRSLCLCILAAVYVISAAGLVSAKVYWLPDFLHDNLDRSSSANFQHDDDDSRNACPSGWLSEAQKGSMICRKQQNFPNAGYCYSECEDPCTHIVDNDCGAYECQQHYDICPAKCEVCYTDNCRNREDVIINAEWGCEKYWEDCSQKCERPHTDNCHNREDNLINEEWGCKKYWEDCDTKCEEPKTDNCENRTDNKTDIGCQKYWDDCETKCEVGKTCAAVDCSSYPLTTPPLNAIYEECSNPCNSSSAKRYRFVACKVGFFDTQKFVCENKQICTWTIN